MVRPVPLALLASLPLVACDRRSPRPGIPPRHVLLVTVEGLRADHCSAYLYPRDTTTFPVSPEMRAAGRALTLDDLAAAGTLFTQAFAPTGHPADSLGALHTGRAVDLARAPGDAVPVAGSLTLAEAFQRAGFETVAFRTGDGGGAEAEIDRGLHRGFDRLERTEGDRETLRSAIEYVTRRDWGNGRGVFLWLHLRQPAPPFEPYILPDHTGETVDYARLYTGPGHDGERDGNALLGRARAGESLTEEERAHLSGLYDGELALTNYLLFYFLDYLRYEGNTSAVWDSTLTVVVGVNGVELGTRVGRAPWEVLRDSSLRVPLVLHHPDSLTGQRIFAELVTLSDVAATLADWFDLELSEPGPHGGRSLLAVTDSYPERPFERRPALAAGAGGRVGLRTSDWRLVLEPGEPPALYRVERMLEVEQDVAAEHPRVVARLRERLGELVGEAE